MAWRDGKVVSLVSDLADFASRSSRDSYKRPAEFKVEEELVAALKQLAAQYKCILDQEIVANGDCGLHAILKNVQRLQCNDDFAKKLLATLARTGLQQACRLLRLKLCLWLKQHSALEILPEVTVEEWVTMEGYENIADYVQQMQVDHIWIDTPMLYAASAVFGLQFMMFLASGSVQLLVASEVQMRGRAPVGLLGNVGNYHFFAVQPAPDEFEFAPAQSRDVLRDACVPNAIAETDAEEISDSEGESEEQQAPVSVDGHFFEMCGALLRWDPFQQTSQDDRLAALSVPWIPVSEKTPRSRHLTPCSGGAPSSWCSTRKLRWQLAQTGHVS